MKAQEEWKGLQLGRLEPEERILTRKLSRRIRPGSWTIIIEEELP